MIHVDQFAINNKCIDNRAKDEVDHLNDLVALLTLFGENEEDDPQLQSLCEELKEKALEAHTLVCVHSRFSQLMYLPPCL